MTGTAAAQAQRREAARTGQPAGGRGRAFPGPLPLSITCAVASAAVTALLASTTSPGTLALARIAALLGIAAAITWIDARTRRIPNRITGPAAASLAASLLASGEHAALGSGATGALVLGGAYGLIACFGTMGFGDVKLAALIGATVLPIAGWGALAVSCITAYLLATPHALIGIARRRRGRPEAGELPFGPYLIAGALWATVPKTAENLSQLSF